MGSTETLPSPATLLSPPTCAVCFNRFDNARRKPVDLGCGHCYCYKCVALNPVSFERCPECRRYARNQHISYALLQLVQEFQRACPPPISTDEASDLSDDMSQLPILGQQLRVHPRAPLVDPATSTITGHRNSEVLADQLLQLPPLPGSALIEQVIQYYRSTWMVLKRLWSITRKMGTVFVVLLYIVFPLDIIPDFIPVLGYLDDLGMVAYCVYLLIQVAKEAAEL